MSDQPVENPQSEEVKQEEEKKEENEQKEEIKQEEEKKEETKPEEPKQDEKKDEVKQEEKKDEVIKYCDVFKNIYMESRGKKAINVGGIYLDTSPSDPYNAKMEKDTDMLRRLQGVEPEKKPRKADKNGLDTNEILNNVKMVQNISNQVEKKILIINHQEKLNQHPKNRMNLHKVMEEDMEDYFHWGLGPIPIFFNFFLSFFLYLLFIIY